MREAKGDHHQVVAAPASGWCEPDTGVCHIDTVDETVSAETNDEGAVTSDAPDATER
ncbi:hypothetical protein AB0D14_39610 [Streptomyces sp. NPDC048484]|uniref:hypothetical protein n=1 Tax=Streptomyces sp. NPDC048484 TaxID=3155146 RepID=UPI00341A58BC